MRMVKIALFLTSIVIMTRAWLSCTKLGDLFYYAPFDLQLRLIEAIHADTVTPLLFVRLFHNKLVGSVIDIFRSYLLYWDIRFLVTMVGFAGLVFFCIGMYYLSKSKQKRVKIVVFSLLLGLPFVEILFRSLVPFLLWLSIFVASISGIGVYGYLQVSHSRYTVWALGILVVLSFWWGYVSNPISLGFCMK